MNQSSSWSSVVTQYKLTMLFALFVLAIYQLLIHGQISWVNSTIAHQEEDRSWSTSSEYDYKNIATQ
jgi:hypothetical protein